jgi:hypothetical protein
MRSDFAAFILTHGRPDRVYTVDAWRRAGYTGKIWIVIDDEDKTADEYRRRYGSDVLMFSKAEIAKTFDIGDNFPGRRSTNYARNAIFDLAQQVGCQYFVQLDDDYIDLRYRFNSKMQYLSVASKSTADQLFEALCDFLDESGADSVAISQGGDHIAGGQNPNNRDSVTCLRKAMNSFVCRTDRRFTFIGRMNEDVNTYTLGSLRGRLFLTTMQSMLTQKQTQTSSGGMTELYLESGTYQKTFYSVMYAPSCVKISELADYQGDIVNRRIHHAVQWNAAAPKILRESVRKPSILPDS